MPFRRTLAAALLAVSFWPASSAQAPLPLDQPTGRFLAYDPAGDGRAIEVLGDLATARKVVVLVPGVDSTLSNFDTGLGGVIRRAPAHQARMLKERLPDDVAVVAWLGYDPPEGAFPEALRADRAVAGARELERFLAIVPPQATMVLIGHSYGSVVIAHTHLGEQVTDVVALGSPGMGALETKARVWKGLAETDWIRRVPNLRIGGLGHGGFPDGTRELPTDGVAGHDYYLEPGSVTLGAITGLTTSSTLA
jgi:pimeloyl-ACP methyl ester carboxylesterase